MTRIVGPGLVGWFAVSAHDDAVDCCLYPVSARRAGLAEPAISATGGGAVTSSGLAWAGRVAQW